MEKTKRIFLKPCPICGSAPYLNNSDAYDPWGDGVGTCVDYYYQCSGCGYIVAPKVLAGRYESGIEKDETTFKAGENWNKAIDDIENLMQHTHF